jgi:hypothetical protein
MFSKPHFEPLLDCISDFRPPLRSALGTSNSEVSPADDAKARTRVCHAAQVHRPRTTPRAKNKPLRKVGVDVATFSDKLLIVRFGSIVALSSSRNNPNRTITKERLPEKSEFAQSACHSRPLRSLIFQGGRQISCPCLRHSERSEEFVLLAQLSWDWQRSQCIRKRT